MLDKECKVLAEVRRSPKRLYILNTETSDLVCLLSGTSETRRYMEKPATDHLAAVKDIKDILRHGKGTIKLGCFYGKSEATARL